MTSRKFMKQNIAMISRPMLRGCELHRILDNTLGMDDLYTQKKRITKKRQFITKHHAN